MHIVRLPHTVKVLACSHPYLDGFPVTTTSYLVLNSFKGSSGSTRKEPWRISNASFICTSIPLSRLHSLQINIQLTQVFCKWFDGHDTNSCEWQWSPTLSFRRHLIVESHALLAAGPLPHRVSKLTDPRPFDQLPMARQSTQAISTNANPGRGSGKAPLIRVHSSRSTASSTRLSHSAWNLARSMHGGCE